MQIVELTAPYSSEHLAAVRELMREYQHSLGVDLCFQGFEDELAQLPGDYAAPDGALWLATLNGQAAACVAIRAIPELDGPVSCELKRLYARPSARGQKIGQRLVELSINKAKSLGYRRMVLDTLPTLAAALALYEQLGFVAIAPYNDNPLAGVKHLALEW